MTSLTTLTHQSPPNVTISAPDSSPQTKRIITISLAAAVIYQVVLLIVVGVQHRYRLNIDGVCYIRIASYYFNGQLDLAVSGYWGPMLSWLMAPLLGLVENPLYAARIVMGASAVVFLFGCISIFRNLDIHPAGLILGTWIVAVATISWSVALITPDLLMGGLMCLAISRMLSPQWTENRFTQFTAGILWGAAYLTKAVAFPLAILMGSAIAALWMIGRRRERRVVFRSLMITLFAFLLVASPWIATLSLKYKSIVFSTSGKINYAIVGPEDVDRYHPSLITFNIPEPGRIASMEDPSNMPYHYWAPWENRDYAKHQLALIHENIATILKHLSNFERLHIGLFAFLFGFLVHKPWRRNLGAQRWRWSAVIVLCLAGIYLPVYARDQRYYYAAYPFLLAASFGMIVWMTPETRERLNLPRWLGFLIVAISFGLPACSTLYRAKAQTWQESRAINAGNLARKLKAAGIHGPIAGGGEQGLCVAFFTNQPWHGDEIKPTAEGFKRSHAKLALVHRNKPIVEMLDHDSTFVNLDSLLFDQKELSDPFTMKVYQINPP